MSCLLEVNFLCYGEIIDITRQQWLLGENFKALWRSRFITKAFPNAAKRTKATLKMDKWVATRCSRSWFGRRAVAPASNMPVRCWRVSRVAMGYATTSASLQPWLTWSSNSIKPCRQSFRVKSSTVLNAWLSTCTSFLTMANRRRWKGHTSVAARPSQGRQSSLLEYPISWYPLTMINEHQTLRSNNISEQMWPKIQRNSFFHYLEG